jgi:hypothetical protein
MACSIKTGQIISHPCGRKTINICPSCKEEICQRHYDALKKTCVICSGAERTSKGILKMERLFEFDDADFAAFESKYMNDDQHYMDS